MTKKIKNQVLYNLYFLQSCGYKYMQDLVFKDDQKDSFDLPSNLKHLSDIVKQCSLCEFSKSRTNTIFGLGSENSKVMMVGDFPSISEDESGTVLNGKYGEMLKNIVKNVLKLTLEDVYFTNIFKCKKTNIQMDKKFHHDCISYLYKQIEIVQPKVIVLLGLDTYKYFFDKNEENLKMLNGSFEEYKGIKVLTTYHPSFLIRNPSFKKDVMADMIKVKTYLES